jgi:tetratricopeptide (TPR) repeat protein
VLKKFFIILVIGVNLNVSANQTAKDSLMAIWNNTSLEDTTRLAAIHKNIKENYIYINSDSAFYLAELEYQLAKKSNLLVHMGNALNTQGISYYLKSEYNKALIYFKKSLKIREEIGFENDITGTLNNIGAVTQAQGEYDKSIKYFNRSLKINKKIGNLKGVASNSNNLGIVFQYKGDYVKSSEYFMNSLKLSEEIKDSKEMASVLNNLGTMYQKQKINDKAMKFFQRSLKIREERGEKKTLTNLLINIGNLYMSEQKYIQAHDYYARSLEISKETGFQINKPEALKGIGNIYNKQGNYEKAIEFYTRGLDIVEKSGNKRAIADHLNNIGVAYYNKGELLKANSYSVKSLTIGRKIGDALIMKNTTENLYKVNKALGNHQKSLEYYELYVSMHDSLENISVQREVIQQEIKYNYEKEAIIDSTAYHKQRSLDALSRKTERYGFIFFIFFISILLAIYFRIRYLKKEKLLQEIELLKANNIIQSAPSIFSNNQQFSLNKEKVELAINTSLNQSDWNILNELYRNPISSNKEIADKVALSLEGVRSSLQKMYRVFEIKTSRNQRIALVVKASQLSNEV